MRYPSEIHGNSICPCGSGTRYSYCCKSAGQRWELTEDGEYKLVVPLCEEAIEIIKLQDAAFVKAFGRSPGKGDLVFPLDFWQSEKETAQETIKTMEIAGVSRHIIYAYYKTGRMIDQAGYKRLSVKDREEWDLAIDEYLSLYEEKQDRPWASQEADPLTDLYRNFLWVVGTVLRKELSDSLQDETLEFTPTLCILCFLTRCLRTLRSIEVLTQNGSFTDSVALIRSLYEIYIKLKYIVSTRDGFDVLVSVPLGLRRGTHTYKTAANGRLDKDAAIEIATGRIFRLGRSNWDFLSECGDDLDRSLYERLYAYLSLHTHADFMMFVETDFWSGEHHLFEESARAAMLYAMAIAIMTASVAQAAIYRCEENSNDLANLIATLGAHWLEAFGVRADRRRPNSMIRKIKQCIINALTPPKSDAADSGSAR